MRLFFVVGLVGFLFFSCTTEMVESPVITIDVTKSYPEKEISLTDIADITYVQLDDSDDDFIFRGNIGAVSDSYFIGTDYQSGDILFFTKDGKPKSKFNHKGGGPEEYSQLRTILYNEQTDELYVHNVTKILVYDSTGEFKRSFSFPDGVWMMNDYALFNKSMVLFDMTKKDRANMIHMRLDGGITEEEEKAMSEDSNPSYLKISTLDGSFEEYINVPEDFMGVDLTVLSTYGGNSVKLLGRTLHMVRHKDGLLLHNHETDTVFLYNWDYELTPYMVQTPSVKSLSPGVYINTVVDRGSYQFIELHILIVKLPGPLVTTNLVRDKNSGAIYSPRIVLNDFKGKEITIDRSTVRQLQNVTEGLIAFNVDELREAYNQGRLSGELKAFLEQTDEANENDILLLLRFK